MSKSSDVNSQVIEYGQEQAIIYYIITIYCDLNNKGCS